MTCLLLIRTRPGFVVLAVDDEVVCHEVPEVVGELLLELVVSVLEKLAEVERSERVHESHAPHDLHDLRDSHDPHGDSHGTRRARS